MRTICLYSLLIAYAFAANYFDERFLDATAIDRWVESNWKKGEGSAGSFAISAGLWSGDALEGLGLRTTDDYRFYTSSSRFPVVFKRRPKLNGPALPLVIQYSVKHEQKWIECGGGYLKLFASGIDQVALSNANRAVLTFGPDICGTQTRHVVFSLASGDQTYNLSKAVRCEANKLTHFYTLIVNPDNTYEIRIDNVRRESGNIYDDLGIPRNTLTELDRQDIEFAGFEIWQVRAGTVFDNILVTDDVAEAERRVQEFDELYRAAERRSFEDADRGHQQEEERVRRRIEEERARQDEQISDKDEL